MDEHLSGVVDARHDVRSCPMAEYRLVEGGTTECRQPADGLAKGGAGGERATRGEGDL
jgi:hypothetical protein